MALSMLASPPVAFPCTAHQHSPLPQPHPPMDALPRPDRADDADSSMRSNPDGVFGKDRQEIVTQHVICSRERYQSLCGIYIPLTQSSMTAVRQR